MTAGFDEMGFELVGTVAPIELFAAHYSSPGQFENFAPDDDWKPAGNGVLINFGHEPK